MKSKKKLIICASVLAVILFASCIIWFVCRYGNQAEPASNFSTEGYSFTIDKTKLLATNAEGEKVIFQADRNGAILSAVVSPNKVYVLCDDVLYSMDADGGNRYKVASKCYNPGELAFSVRTEYSTELTTLGYYDGYVYFIQYGSTSKLMRFEVGGSTASEICKNTVSAFTISADGVLVGYSGTDNPGNGAVTIELDLKSL